MKTHNIVEPDIVQHIGLYGIGDEMKRVLNRCKHRIHAIWHRFGQMIAPRLHGQSVLVLLWVANGMGHEEQRAWGETLRHLRKQCGFFVRWNKLHHQNGGGGLKRTLVR